MISVHVWPLLRVASRRCMPSQPNVAVAGVRHQSLNHSLIPQLHMSAVGVCCFTQDMSFHISKVVMHSYMH